MAVNAMLTTRTRRRPGVLLHISESAADHEDATRRRLGVVVCHRPGTHGCKFAAAHGDSLHADERCYFCQACTPCCIFANMIAR